MELYRVWRKTRGGRSQQNMALHKTQRMEVFWCYQTRQMKCCRVSIFLLSLIRLFFFASESQQLSLPSLPPSSVKPATALVAALDGTMYLVDSVSARVIWSFSTGSPIYHHSYRVSINDPNVTGLIECGDDWELILHDAHFGKTVVYNTSNMSYVNAFLYSMVLWYY